MGALIVFGYGPGISHATAERFGREGYSLALVARNAERLAEGVARLKAGGIDATAYRADAADPAMIRQTVTRIRNDLGAVSAVLWTAFRSGGVTDVLSTDPGDVNRVFDVGVTGLLTCTREVLDDLKSSAGAAILVANGSVGEHTSESDAFTKFLGIDGVALENAAKSKLVGILAERLREFGVYVGEVTIAGSVKGTPTASPTAIEPSEIAEKFWSLTRTRDTTRVRMVE
ncbi:SDR family NAD(P)-dependent oxidoreductase [Streptomyces sp. NPDC102274]|uniref:SDR family NAD(P)-dependent oxidoreductase n=1 Tax=Streptomyces sp. NPDC102274 TaxID=3366151 RepID=UPI00381C1BD0